MYKSKTNYRIDNTGASFEMIGPSSHRYALVIFPPAVGRVTLSNDPVTADGVGIVLAAGQTPLYLDVDSCGDIVQRPWNALYAGGATCVGWIDVLP